MDSNSDSNTLFLSLGEQGVGGWIRKRFQPLVRSKKNARTVRRLSNLFLFGVNVLLSHICEILLSTFFFFFSLLVFGKTVTCFESTCSRGGWKRGGRCRKKRYSTTTNHRFHIFFLHSGHFFPLMFFFRSCENE